MKMIKKSNFKRSFKKHQTSIKLNFKTGKSDYEIEITLQKKKTKKNS